MFCLNKFAEKCVLRILGVFLSDKVERYHLAGSVEHEARWWKLVEWKRMKRKRTRSWWWSREFLSCCHGNPLHGYIPTHSYTHTPPYFIQATTNISRSTCVLYDNYPLLLLGCLRVRGIWKSNGSSIMNSNTTESMGKFWNGLGIGFRLGGRYLGFLVGR